MLTIRGRLITPFVLGSMSVGLNILIRHSFMDLWFWISALVPWPQLLFSGARHLIKKLLERQIKNLCSVVLSVARHLISKISLYNTMMKWNRGPPSRKHAYIILTSLKPHFYVVKLVFTGVYIIFLFVLKNIDCGYSLEPPRWGGSNEYPQYIFEQKYEKYQFLSENWRFRNAMEF